MNKRDLRDKAVEEGSKLAARGFRRWMDRFARKRPTGLVSRFRSFFGLTTEAERRRAHEEMISTVQKAVDEYRDDKTPVERPRK